MKKLVDDAKLADHVQVDSAGTSAYHIGENADHRTREIAKTLGVSIDQRARQFVPEDFDRFDYVIAMDRSNLKVLERLSIQAAHRNKLDLLRTFDPNAEGQLDVPDPYYGGQEGFRRVFEICMRSCQGLLQHIRKTHDL